MVEVKFCKNDKNSYSIFNNDIPPQEIGIWLFFELVMYDRHCKELFKQHLPAKEKAFFYGDLNYGFLENDRAFIGDQYDEEKKEFELDRSHLLEMINKWEDLCNRDAKEIIVRRDGERFEIEGVFE